MEWPKPSSLDDDDDDDEDYYDNDYDDDHHHHQIRRYNCSTTAGRVGGRVDSRVESSRDGDPLIMIRMHSELTSGIACDDTTSAQSVAKLQAEVLQIYTDVYLSVYVCVCIIPSHKY